jgi:hypothetical protein
VKRDPVLVYSWLKIAAASGEAVSKALEIEASQLSATDLSEAQHMAETWIQQHRLKPMASALVSSNASALSAR